MEPTATHPDPEVPVTARSPSRTKAALAALAVAGMLTAFGAASVFAEPLAQPGGEREFELRLDDHDAHLSGAHLELRLTSSVTRTARP
jgi:hypothetical protein